MTPVAALTVVATLLLAPLVFSAVRARSLLSMAVRNVRRRRGEAVLVVAGSLLGTAIITSAFVVGDIVDGSITDSARTTLGPIDVVLAPAEGTDLPAVASAVDDAGITTVDGTLPATSATAALAVDGEDRDGGSLAVPDATVLELDLEAGRGFGHDPAITGLDTAPSSLASDEVLLNTRVAERLEAAPGDVVDLHAYGTTVEVEVVDVLDEEGLAGFGGGIVAPGTLAGLHADAGLLAAPPRQQLLVSLEGGVFDTREQSDGAVRRLRGAVAAIPGVEVEAPKADLLDAAEREGATFSELFTTIGSFSVIAGVLLLVNLFVMLAEERKTELGMLRAIGFTRRRLTRAFAIEGAAYAVVASALGTAVGVGVGWAVAQAAGAIFDIGGQGVTFRLEVQPTSLALGGLTGLAMSLVTIWLTSIRIARLNIIRAIRDVPEPTQPRLRPRTLVLATLGVLVGGVVTGYGHAQQEPISLLAGVPVAAFCASPLLRRLLSERPARLLVAATALGWGVAAFPVFGEVMGNAEMETFVVQGVVLVAGAVSLATTLDTTWARLVERLASGGRALAPRLGLAYPLARRFRTSMLLGMFSLVIFTMTVIATLSAAFDAQADTYTADARGGFDLLVDTNPANPVVAGDLTARPGVEVIAGLSRTFARFDAEIVTEPRPWPITGMDADLVVTGPPTLSAFDPAYGSEREAYEAVLADPALAIVDDFFLQEGGPTNQRVRVGDSFAVMDPISGEPRALRAVGITSADWVFNGAMVSRELTGQLFGAQDVASRHYLAVADGTDGAALVADLDVDLLANGGDATTFATAVDEGLRQQLSFLVLLQAFLGLGLLVGIAGLGVVMVRAVRERRQEIGMLRALGFRPGLVRAAFLLEAGLIALQGVTIGAVLGLVTARQIMTSGEAFGDAALTFVVPWTGLAVVMLTPLLAALAATAWPASRAAAIRPAVALRLTD